MRVALPGGETTTPYRGVEEPFDVVIAHGGAFAIVCSSSWDDDGKVQRVALDGSAAAAETLFTAWKHDGVEKPTALALAAGDGWALAVSNRKGTLHKLDLEAHTATRVPGDFPGAIGVALVGGDVRALISLRDKHKVVEVDLAAGAVTREFGGFKCPHHIAVPPGGGGDSYALVALSLIHI